jgi:hypothetical protein
VRYGADLISQKITKYVIEDVRKTQVFVRNNALLQPPANAFAFDIINGIQAGTPVALPNGGGYQTVAQYTVPDGTAGVLRYVGHDISNVLAWPNIQWRLRVGQTTVGTYVGWFGQIGTMLNPFERYYTKIAQKGTIFLDAQNVGFGPPVTATGRIGGWYFFTPQSSEGYQDTLVD